MVPLTLINPKDMRISRRVNALIDGGCSGSCLTVRITDILQLSYVRHLFSTSVFGVEEAIKMEGGMGTVLIRSDDGFINMPIRIQILPNPIPNLLLPDWNELKHFWPHFSGVEFPQLANPLVIDIVIGQDLIGLTQIYLELRLTIP